MDALNTKLRRPFHETIVDTIKAAISSIELVNLGELIMATTIPQNHDRIIEAWNQRIEENLKFFGTEIHEGVIASLLEQKREAEVQAKRKEKTVPLQSTAD